MHSVLDPRDQETERLLADLARLINRHGPDSPEVLRFMKTHAGNPEFTQLGNLSRDLKKALM